MDNSGGVDLKAIRFLVRAALKALEDDVNGEHMYEVEKNLRTAAALLVEPTGIKK